jgi:hypothetical protein
VAAVLERRVRTKARAVLLVLAALVQAHTLLGFQLSVLAFQVL